jgi:hypothetical protein
VSRSYHKASDYRRKISECVCKLNALPCGLVSQNQYGHSSKRANPNFTDYVGLIRILPNVFINQFKVYKMEMPKLTRYLGIFLIAIGLVAYFGSGMVSLTAMIPSFFGIVFLAGGILAEKEKMRKHVMHVVVLIAVLALFGTFRGLTGFIGYLGGAELERPLASGIQALMAVLMIGYIAVAIKSFVNARRKPAV